MKITKELVQNLYVDQKKSTVDTCTILGIGRTTFYKYLAKFGIENRGQQKYFPKDDFFSTWSHEMAYCLGFISADGHVWKDRPFLTIGIGASDIDVLTYIKDQISPTSLVRHSPKHNAVQINIKSKQIYSDLAKYNVTNDKTFNLKIDFEIPDKFWGDYLRGYFDGDGSIWLSKKLKVPVHSGSIVSASKQFLVDVQNRLDFGYVRPTHGGKYFSLDFSNRQLLLLKDIIYSDTSRVVMNRKYEKFLDVRINENYNLWTEEEELIISNNLDKPTRHVFKLLPNRTPASIQTKRNKIVKHIKNSKN